VSRTVVVQEAALRALARIRSEDKESFAAIRQALAALADQPRPDRAVAWGGSGICRLHLPGVLTTPLDHAGSPPPALLDAN